MPNAETKPRLVIALVVAACLIGFFLRLYFYAIDRSLWQDEVKLALNLVGRSFPDLLKPLDFGQGAPIGFLILQKAIIASLGSSEYILRLIPLLAGLASVPIMYLAAKQYGGQLFSLISLGLLALSPRLIYYSSELKQYSTDVLAALVLLLIAPKCLEDKSKPHALVALGIAGCLAMWISHPSLFVFAGISLALGLAFAVRRDSRRLFWLVGVGAVWAANLSLVYFVNLRYLESNHYLLDFWNRFFAPLPPWSDLRWYKGAFVGMLRDPAGLRANAIAVGLLIIGVTSFAFRRWELMLILVVPFLLTMIASALGKYPFSGRLLLFLVPLVYLLLAEAVQRVWLALGRVNRPVAGLVSVALVAVLLWGPIAAAYRDIQSPPLGEDIKPIMSYVRENRLGTDLVYVYYGAELAFQFYAPRIGFDRNDYVVGVQARDDPNRYLEDVDRIRGSQRVWFVFSHNCYWCTVNEQDFILEHLDEIGLKRDEQRSGDAYVFLYDLGRSS